MEDKQKAKNQILQLLKLQGAQTATELAEKMQVSPMAVRQHLQTLQAEQWITYEEQRRPLGRPVKLWQLTDQCGHLFPDSHAELMVDLLKSLEVVFGPAAIEKLLADRTQRQIFHYQSRFSELAGTQNWQKRVETLAQLRSQEGYMAEVLASKDQSVLLVENHCPVKAAARTCQLLCRCELQVFRTLLGPAVTVERVEHILQGDRRCAYRVKSRE